MLDQGLTPRSWSCRLDLVSRELGAHHGTPSHQMHMVRTVTRNPSKEDVNDMSVRSNRIQWDLNPKAQRIMKAAMEGHVFTIKYMASRVNMPIYTTRDYVNGLRDRLLVRIVNPSAPPSIAQQFQWYDAIQELDTAPDSDASRHLNVLKALALRYRAGEVDQVGEALDWERSALEHNYEMQKQDVDNMKKLLDCKDLWIKKTLVERLGFDDLSDDRASNK